MIYDTPMTRTKDHANPEFLNELEAMLYDDVQADPYPLALAQSLATTPPGPRPPPTIAAADAHTASTYGLFRDRETAALLSNLLTWAY